MGSNTRYRSIRNNRKSRHHQKPPPPPPPNPPSAAADDDDDDVIHPSLPAEETDRTIENPNIPNPSMDESWDYLTEDQLEEYLLNNLEFIYREAQAKLVSLGYSDEVALRSLLHNGHCYGSMDPLSNVIHNAVSYINSTSSSDARDRRSTSSDDDEDDPSTDAHDLPLPTSLRQLQQYSLAAMVCLLQQVRPNLSRGDALWCLLMGDLHVGRAASIEISNTPRDAAPPEEEVEGESEMEIPKGIDLNPDMTSVLRRNVALFAAGFRANSRSAQRDCCPRKPPPEELTETVESVLRMLEEMSIGEGADEETAKKREAIENLGRQVKELEVQVKERREWAQKKALQAAKKLNADLTEMRVLKMEREENQNLKKGKPALEDSTVKRLSEMETALRKVSGEIEKGNSAVRKLEMENAELRAEMEAAKLSEYESRATESEAAKRARRQHKKFIAAERARDAMLAELAEERRRVAEVQQKIQLVKEAQKEAEVKWRQEVHAKDLAITEMEEERRAKKVAEASVKRTHEALHSKIELDFQRHKDDIQRLEEELSCLNASIESNSKYHHMNSPSAVDMASAIPPVETNTSSQDRQCLICKKNEASIVFLPCAHQVMCFDCNENHKKSKTSCQCCGVPIKQRIHVFGARS
ncbi:MND1-interacting protein 1 [Acorus calamus]|uniref:MND1-interacting protein 1 n=1 Tax=Acorus calamus TaxID=4465 RepID=A0AAV9FL84_ACOCL|nr:MND1-interacting protein 1 [Acorus calamus]